MKNIILLNNRSLHLYDFKELKKNYDLRISAVVFEDSYKTLSDEIKENLDKIYVLPDIICPEQKFPAFPKRLLYPIVENEISKHKNTWILTVEELNNLNAALLRKKYSLSGTSASIATNYTNKVKQKEILAQFGVRIPKFLAVQRENNEHKLKNIYQYLIHTLKSPFILKPIDMGGTIGVEKIETFFDFTRYFIKYKQFSNLIAEEFIKGQLYHCDFIIQNNKYFFEEASEYLYNGLAFVQGFNHGSLLLKREDKTRQSIINFCKEANTYLGLTAGSAHFEVFITKDLEIIFLEAAARAAGSLVPFVYTKMFRKNYLNNALLAEISENIEEAITPEEYYLWAAFPRKAGLIKSLKTPLIESSYTLEWYVKENDNLPQSSSSVVEKAGIFVAYNNNYEILKKDFQSLRNFDAIDVASN